MLDELVGHLIIEFVVDVTAGTTDYNRESCSVDRLRYHLEHYLEDMTDSITFGQIRVVCNKSCLITHEPVYLSMYLTEHSTCSWTHDL